MKVFIPGGLLERTVVYVQVMRRTIAIGRGIMDIAGYEFFCRTQGLLKLKKLEAV